MTPEALIVEQMFMIADKEGNDVPFTLNPAQRALDEELTGRDIIPKARQEGISSYFLARYTAACLSKRNTRAVIISHEGEATQRLLQRCGYFLEHIRGPKAVTGRDSLRAITFPKTNSSIWIGTAGSRKFGRGDTITHLHCSEYAYWQNGPALLGGLLDSVPLSGEVAIESTGNGKGNDYHKRCKRAFEGQSQYTCHFFNWQDFPEYTLNLTREEEAIVLSNLNEEWGEPELVKNFGLTAGQIAWRRIKLEEKDYDIRFFEQEYPMSFDECFQASGDSVFATVRYEKTNLWKDRGNHFWSLEGHPTPNGRYALGADPAGGVGLDNSTIEIISLDTMEQVGEYAHNRIDPYTFGSKIASIAVEWNGAFITVESNNHGPVTIKAIQDAGYPEFLMYSMQTPGQDFEDKQLLKLGFRTTQRTKPIMIGKLRTSLATELTIHSELLNDELSTYTEGEDGKLGAQPGCNDDRVVALAACNMGLEQAALYVDVAKAKKAIKGAYKDPFLLDNIIEEMRKPSSGLPVRPQVRTSDELM